jgi:hypothetical protein
MDATAGTNKYKFALSTIMVFVPDGPALPVAWLLHSSNSEATLLQAVNALAERLGPRFTPSVVLLDDALAEINAIKKSAWCGLPHCVQGRVAQGQQAGNPKETFTEPRLHAARAARAPKRPGSLRRFPPIPGAEAAAFPVRVWGMRRVPSTGRGFRSPPPGSWHLLTSEMPGQRGRANGRGRFLTLGKGGPVTASPRGGGRGVGRTTAG